MTVSTSATWTLTRRQVLGAGLALGSAAAFGGCSPSSGAPSAAQATALQPDVGKITLLSWETYSDKPWLQEYSKASGIAVEAIIVGSGDELFAKLQSGAVKPDLCYFDAGLIERFSKANLIAPANAALVKNIKMITPGLDWEKKNTFNDHLYGIPYNWGTQPLMYNAEVIKTKPDSWGALWDPAYKGKVVMFDAADVTIPMVALYIGAADPYHLTDEEFEKVRQALKELRPQVRTIAKGFDDAVNIFAAGDGVIGYCQNISEVTALNKAGKKFDWAFPKEGTPMWQDNSILTPSGQRQEVYDFIDATLTSKWQARFIESSSNNGVLSVAEAKKAEIPEATLKGTNVLDQEDPEFWKGMSPLENPESISKRLEIWNEFKAG